MNNETLTRLQRIGTVGEWIEQDPEFEGILFSLLKQPEPQLNFPHWPTGPNGETMVPINLDKFSVGLNPPHYQPDPPPPNGQRAIGIRARLLRALAVGPRQRETLRIMAGGDNRKFREAMFRLVFRGDAVESEGAIFTLTEKGRQSARYFVEHPERIKEDKAR